MLNANPESYPFFQGGGKTGAVVRQTNWSVNRLGLLPQWPCSLRTSVSNLLRTSLPTWVLWGPEQICFYNDAIVPTFEPEKLPPIGQPAGDLGAAGWDFVVPLAESIRQTGEPVSVPDVPLTLYRNGQPEAAYWTVSGSLILDDEGTPGGVLVTCVDTTQAVLTRQKLAESGAKLEAIVHQVHESVAIGLLLGRDLVIDMPNQSFINTISKGNAIEGKALGEVMPELESQPFLQLLDNVYTSGKAFHSYESPVSILRNGELVTRYFNVLFTPLFDAAGQVYAILDISIDVTEQVITRLQTEEAKKETDKKIRLYETIASSTPDLLYVFDLNYRFTYVNQALLTMWGSTWEQSVGKGLLENGYEPWHAEMHEREIDQVVATKRPIRGEVSFPHAVLGKRIYDYVFAPIFNENGEVEAIAGTTRDITEIRNATLTIQESEARFRTMAEGTNVLIAVGDETSNATYFNTAWTELTGRPMKDLLSFGWVDLVHPEDRQRYVNVYLDAFNVRKSFTSELRVQHPLGDYRWLLAHGTPRFHTDGSFAGYISSCVDITEQKATQLALEESKATLQQAIDLAELGTWTIDATSGIVTYSERLQSWLGISGSVPYTRDALRHPNDRERVRVAIEKALEKGSNGRFDEVYTILNAVTGQQRIIHASGQTLFGADGQALSLSGTAQDVTLQQELQLALEQQVQHRTEELAAVNEELSASNEDLAATNTDLEEANGLLTRSNESLQTFAYVASHDLQEPLRKIQQFGDVLKTQYGETLGEGVNYLDRMQSAANRMSTLIRDLLSFSRISTRRDVNAPVSLQTIVETVLNTLELTVQETGAQIRVHPLPVVFGDASQLGQLFQNLLSNALKFRQPGNLPLIEVRSGLLTAAELPASVKPSRPAQQYHRIEVADNGIGFDEKYLDRIFQVFQRLHGKSQYAGTGIGLAICEKVMTNHGGAITATSQPGKGATFTMFFPA